MRSIKIIILHTGRYRIEVYSDDDMFNSFDCGSAGLMVTLNKLIFQDEALAYEMDRKKSSDSLAEEALQKMFSDPASQVPIKKVNWKLPD